MMEQTPPASAETAPVTPIVPNAPLSPEAAARLNMEQCRTRKLAKGVCKCKPLCGDAKLLQSLED